MACSVVERSDGELYDLADKIFVGMLISARRADDEDSFHGVELTLRVLEIFKGEVDSVERIYTGFGNGDCGLGVDFHTKYLIFSDKSGYSGIDTGGGSGNTRQTIEKTGEVHSRLEESWLEPLRKSVKKTEIDSYTQ